MKCRCVRTCAVTYARTNAVDTARLRRRQVDNGYYDSARPGRRQSVAIVVQISSAGYTNSLTTLINYGNNEADMKLTKETIVMLKDNSGRCENDLRRARRLRGPSHPRRRRRDLM
ncbi:hypothetical protein EVAR_99158_1 [Eumeta japonica]|uniref:Uncharacterized protein n=1 Tax=Eumeta variegata TaxID=151549 RepID=A0A4C1YF01_EUMVA|nr:hypothetical protein EVAR_99158_1 [Eumeta japonica]